MPETFFPNLKADAKNDQGKEADEAALMAMVEVFTPENMGRR